MEESNSVRKDDVASLMEEDHAQVDLIFRDLMEAFEKADAAWVFRLVDFLWARLAVHIRAEHLSLFPTIVDKAAKLSDDEAGAPLEELQSSISELRHDHDFFMRQLAEAINRMRPHVHNPQDPLSTEQLDAVKQIVERVRARLESHNRLEEEQVYQWPAVLLNAEERLRLINELKLQLENLPPRFNTPSERRRCLGILFNSSSFENRVVDDARYASFTILIGGSAEPERVYATDEEIREIVREELSSLLGIKGEPLELVINRWSRAIPKYSVSLPSVWQQAQATWCARPGRILFGNYAGQVSLRGMIEDAASMGR